MVRDVYTRHGRISEARFSDTLAQYFPVEETQEKSWEGEGRGGGKLPSLRIRYSRNFFLFVDMWHSHRFLILSSQIREFKMIHYEATRRATKVRESKQRIV